MPAVAILEIIAALALLAAALASLARGRWLWGAVLIMLGIGAPMVLPATWTELRMSPYKGLSQALTIPDARIEEERSSPLGLVHAVRSDTIPFRHVPGLSLNNTIAPAEQIGVFVDGDGPSPITAFDGRFAPLRYLDFTTSALPYHLLEEPRVLILGAGGGTDVLLALFHGAARVDAVELDPNVTALVQDSYAAFAGRIYARPEVVPHSAEARGFVGASTERYDLIFLPLLDSLATAAAGTRSLSEGFVYTVEAFEAYLQHLRPEGFLAITRWLKLPPRDSLKLMLTALVALELRGDPQPARHIALIRGWDTTTLLVKNAPLTDAELATIRAFAEERSFDLAYLPDLEAETANRMNVLARPDFFAGARALVGPERDAFLRNYKFDLTPATDDRPYFFDAFKWRSLPELLARRAQTGPALLDWGYVILFATLAQTIGLSLVLILAPLRLGLGRYESSPDRWRVAFYFLAIGLAFLFVEIASIQRFMLILSHPVYAIAVVLAAFLVFAGLGSGVSALMDRWLRARTAGGYGALELAVLTIVLLALVYVFGLPLITLRLVALPDVAKVVMIVALIAPLAFVMGMPFPLALARVKTRLPHLVPWVWGINGCASVISAVLATLLAMTLGFRIVVLLAAALYLAAAFALRRPLTIGHTDAAAG
jgi:spermidine synthase